MLPDIINDVIVILYPIPIPVSLDGRPDQPHVPGPPNHQVPTNSKSLTKASLNRMMSRWLSDDDYIASGEAPEERKKIARSTRKC